MTADLYKVNRTERWSLPLRSKHGPGAGHFESPYVISSRSHNIYVVAIDDTTVFINLCPVACTNMGPVGWSGIQTMCLFEDLFAGRRSKLSSAGFSAPARTFRIDALTTPLTIRVTR